MNANQRKKILRRLLAKPVPERYSLTVPEEVSKTYDWLIVRGSTSHHKDVMLRSIDPKTSDINFLYWDDDALGATAKQGQCEFEDIKWETLIASHTFRTWDVTYDSLNEAYIHDRFALQRFKWRLQRLRDRFIRPVQPSYRIKLLKLIVDRYTALELVQLEDLMIATYGRAVRLSKDNYRFHKELKFVIKSLVESGDVIERNDQNHIEFISDDSSVRPTPKALSTLALDESDRRRHQDSIALGRAQLFLGFAMFLLAAATFYAELSSWLLKS